MTSGAGDERAGSGLLASRASQGKWGRKLIQCRSFGGSQTCVRPHSLCDLDPMFALLLQPTGEPQWKSTAFPGSLQGPGKECTEHWAVRFVIPAMRLRPPCARHHGSQMLNGPCPPPLPLDPTTKRAATTHPL